LKQAHGSPLGSGGGGAKRAFTSLEKIQTILNKLILFGEGGNLLRVSF